MKIGFLSDLHIKTYKSSETFLPFILKSIELFITECKKRNIKKVFILGDVFHVKHTISLWTQSEAINSLNRIFSNFETYMIPGNHDLLSKRDTSINSLKIFKDSCHLFEDATSIDIEENRFHFVPYFPDDVLKEKIKNLQLSSNKNYLCCHVGFKGFLLDNNHEDIYSEMTPRDIDRGFAKIFTGHYHSHQMKNNIVYISSPYESHFNDEGLHGFVFYDTQSDSIEFFENYLSPRFVSFELNASNLDIINKTKNSFIKLIIKKHVDNHVLLKYRERLLKNNFDVQYVFDISSSATKISVAKDWSSFVSESPDQILRSYINENTHLPEGFTKEDFLNYIGV